MSFIKQVFTCALLYCLLFISIFAVAQEGIPVIKTYSVENYQAGIENWDVLQDPKGLMYFANSEGILEFDGINWQLIPGSVNKKFRTLAQSKDGKIYAGGDHDFGFLKPDKNGHLNFLSLKEKCPKVHQHLLSHVWKVLLLGTKKYFLASGAILVFDGQDNFVKILDSNIYLRSFFLINNKLIAYSNQSGILELDTTTLVFNKLYNDPFILNRSLEYIASHPLGGLRFHIFDKGFYRLHHGKTSLEKKSFNSTIDTDYIFCKNVSKNVLSLGTTINGLYTLNNNTLEVDYHFSKNIGLNDNKVFAMHTDINENIWVCHESGISYIKINDPIRIINETMGIKGTGLCTIEYDSVVFAGTTNGLFVSKKQSNKSFYEFSLFENIRQPIYFLEKKNNNLLIGCLHQLYEYDGKKLVELSTSKLNSKIRELPGKPNKYIVATNSGFLLVSYNRNFKVEKKIVGFDTELHDFVIDSDHNIWFIDSDFNLKHAQLNGSNDSLKLVNPIISKEFPNLKCNTVSYFDNLLLIGTNEGLFYYDYPSNTLTNIDLETNHNFKKFSCNWIYNQDNTKLWYEKSYYKNGKLSYKIDQLSEYHVNTEANNLNAHIYGNKAFSFKKLNHKQLAIGTVDGFLLFDQETTLNEADLANSYIRKIIVSDDSDTTELKGLWLGNNNSFSFPLNQEATTITMQCAANLFYSGDKVTYSYMMEGVETDWQEWTTNNIARYTINNAGEYIFHVKATSNQTNQSQTTSYRFKIRNPWYKTIWWYSIEIFTLVLIMLTSAYLNRSKNSKLNKASAFMLILIILTFFEISSELLGDWLNAQGVTIFALKIVINITIALSINPIEHYIRKKLIRPINNGFN